MNKLFSFLLLIVTLSSQTTALDAAQIQAGISMVDITPPIGGGTTGYSSAPPTDGVHDPISARVLFLESSHTTAAIVTWDLCVFNSPWLHEKAAELEIDHLLLCNTHTHAGPNMRQLDFPDADRPWKQTVEERVWAAIEEARNNLAPVYLAAGEGELQLGYNRLVRQPEGHSLTHFNNPERIPFGPVDPAIGVLRLTDEFNTVRAVIVNYACHPVVLGPRNAKISAGYPGVMRKRIEAKLGNNAMCLFIQGGAGDINPLILAREPNDRGQDFELVESLGKLLSDEVLKILGHMKDQPGRSESLLAQSKVLTVGHRFEPGESLDVGVASLLINQNIGIVTMPGEPFHKFQYDLREKAELPQTFFFGYCCNAGYRWPAYLPDLQSAARGGYGASDTTRAEVGTGERLLNQGLVQLFQLQGRLKDEPRRHIVED